MGVRVGVVIVPMGVAMAPVRVPMPCIGARIVTMAIRVDSLKWSNPLNRPQHL